MRAGGKDKMLLQFSYISLAGNCNWSLIICITKLKSSAAVLILS